MKTILLIFVLANYTILSYGGNTDFDNDSTKLVNNYWVLHSFIDTTNNDTTFYPSHGKKIWIDFKEDSVFLHGYCPTVGTWYNLINDASIEVGPLEVQLECNEPDLELSGWNYETTCLSSAYHYEFYNDQLIINTEIRTMVFNQTNVITDIVNINTNEHSKSLLLNSYSNSTGHQIISYFLPQSTKDAYINVYNLEGKKLYSLTVQTKGHSSIEISNDMLNKGMYLYSLFVDGIKVDTKKMIVSENE